SLSRLLARFLATMPLRRRLGLDRVKLAFTGAAPIAIATQELFASLGLPLHENYAMSEASSLLTAATPDRPRFGTVGKPLPGVEIRIAADGEILARGPNLSPGYLHDEARTAAAWQDGWFHTGD